MRIVRLTLEQVKEGYKRDGHLYLENIGYKDIEIDIETELYLQNLSSRNVYQHILRNGVTEEALEQLVNEGKYIINTSINNSNNKHSLNYYEAIEEVFDDYWVIHSFKARNKTSKSIDYEKMLRYEDIKCWARSKKGMYFNRNLYGRNISGFISSIGRTPIKTPNYVPLLDI